MKIIRTLQRCALLWLLAAAALLTACGGGEGQTSASTSAGVGGASNPLSSITGASSELIASVLSSINGVKHRAGLGQLVGAKVEVMNAFDISKTVFYSTTTGTSGEFTIDMTGADSNGMYLVRVSGGVDVDVNNDGQRDATSTPFNGVLYALASAQDLTAPIRISMLSDMAFRLIGESASLIGEIGLLPELNRLAVALLNQDLDGQNGIDAHDLLVFDATRADHRDALISGWATYSQKSLPADSTASEQTAPDVSILDKYYSGATDLTAGYRNTLASVPGLLRTLKDEQDSPYMTIKVNVQGNGEVNGSALNGSVLTSNQGTRALPMAKDTSQTLSFNAVETDNQWRFHSWVGCTTASGSRCDVVLTQSASIQARFELKTPVLQAAVKSLTRITPAQGLTGIRFNGTTATVMTRDPITTTSLLSLQAGSVLNTGHRDHPLVWVKSVTTQQDAPDLSGGTVHTTVFEFTEAGPGEVYSEVSIIADPAPLQFADVKAITVSDGVDGSVKTVIPWPDYSVSVAQGKTASATPSWYVTRATDGKSCNGFGSDDTVRGALQSAWQSEPKGYPFNGTALAACLSLGQFQIGGDLASYVAAKVGGDADLASGHNDSATLLAQRRQSSGSMLAKIAPKNGQRIERQGEPVWLAGVGPAVYVGQDLYLAQRQDGKAGFQLVGVQKMHKITRAEAVKQARADCSLRGDGNACALVASITRERAGMQNAGYIPLLNSPISVAFEQPKYFFKATFSLQVNIDVTPRVSASWRGITDISVSAGADFTIRPELGIKIEVGRLQNVDRNLYRKKFDPKDSNNAGKQNKGSNSKRLLTIDLARLIPSLGAATELRVNLLVGVEFSGNISVTVTPFVELGGNFGIDGGYRCGWVSRWWGGYPSCSTYVNPSFNMPTKRAGYELNATGQAQIMPYGEVNLSAGVRGVAEDIGKVYVKAGFPIKGQASTGMSYNKKSWQDSSPGYWSNFYYPIWNWCSTDYARANLFQCGCMPFFSGYSCQYRNFQTWVPGRTTTVYLRCIDSPSLSVGVSFSVEAGVEVSSEAATWPINQMGLKQTWTLYSHEWPIWSFPESDNDNTSGCRPV